MDMVLSKVPKRVNNKALLGYTINYISIPGYHLVLYSTKLATRIFCILC
jgi:hypothetical protein